VLRPKDALPAASAVFIALALLGLAAAPAEAHRLRVFATVEAGAIEGYAFFVGGGRPADAAVRFVQAGEVVHATTTDEAGAFAWRPQDSGAITVVVDPGGGHVAEVTLDAERFGGEANRVPAPAPATGGTTPSGLDPAVEAAIEAAVARQIRPLLEAQAETQSRVRLTDVAGGIGMIVGLTGVALWARTRGSGRRDH
jgi:nickel transport protein